VDLSARQIADGQAALAELVLANKTLAIEKGGEEMGDADQTREYVLGRVEACWYPLAHLGLIGEAQGSGA
jgi:hypothetical protein